MPLPSVRPQVKEYLAKGLTIRQISKLLDISTQRVWQIKKAIEETEATATTQSGGASDA